jgi:tRNA-splicing ligase RtcB
MPFIDPYVALMPDAHFGKGASVGTVLPTRGAIIPAAVGVDIGCGMIAHRTQFTLAYLAHRIEQGEVADRKTLHRAISVAIPSSVARYNTHVTDHAHIFTERLEDLPGAQQAYEVAPNWPLQLGTLGSGNHFIEVTVDEEDRVWLFLHSGSRGVGNRLAQKHIKTALDYTVPGFGKPARYPLVNKDLAYLEEGTPEFDAYIRDLRWAQTFALLNRQEMMYRLTAEFEAWIDERVIVSERINCHHNYTERYLPAGQEDPADAVWLSRKGAIDASAGTLGLIPGSMGVASYVVEGLGNWQSLDSAPHGAGRLHSRGSAKRTFTLDQMESDMKGIEWAHDVRLLDETPAAYKPITQVIDDARDLVDVVHELHPILNVKGL